MTEIKHVFIDALGNKASIRPNRTDAEHMVLLTTVRQDFDAVVFTHTVAGPKHRDNPEAGAQGEAPIAPDAEGADYLPPQKVGNGYGKPTGYPVPGAELDAAYDSTQFEASRPGIR